VDEEDTEDADAGTFALMSVALTAGRAELMVLAVIAAAGSTLGGGLERGESRGVEAETGSTEITEDLVRIDSCDMTSSSSATVTVPVVGYRGIPRRATSLGLAA
jgi:hypothetical protein